MNTILTLTDFSQVANYALEAAIEFAVKHNAELVIFHALKDSEQVNYDLADDTELSLRNKKNEQINAKLDMWKELAQEKDVKIQLTIGAGNLENSIQDIIKTREIEMIVMGSTGIDNSDNVWGSTTQQIIKKVEVPVLVIKSPMRDYKMDDLLFVSDLDLEDQSVLSKSLTLLQPTKDAVIRLMSVNTTSFYSQPRALMTSVLKDFEKLVLPYTADSTFYNDYSVTAGIRHFLENHKPDVLIMSNKNRHPIKDIFLPNAALNAVATVDCPVLIIK